MKKIFLFSLVFLSFSWANVQAQTQANIFASELRASIVDDNGYVTFTYTLNADASEIVITVNNGPGGTAGDVFPITSGVGLTKGVNSVKRQLSYNSATNVNYTWKVKATGITDNTNTGLAPKQFTNDDLVQLKFWSPYGGVVMDKTQNSKYFGRLYIAESSGGLTAEGNGPHRTTTDGIYILNAAMEDVTGQGVKAFQGGEKWDYKGVDDFTPYRITVAPDGRVFIPKNFSTYRSLWIMDPALPEVAIPQGSGDVFTNAFASNSTSVYGWPIQAHLLEDGNLYLFDDNNPNISRYNNFTAPRAAGPDGSAYDSSTATTSFKTGYISGFVYGSCAPDGKGGWWIAQYVAAGNSPYSLMHINSSGSGNFGYTRLDLGAGIYMGAVAFDIDNNLLAVGTASNVKVYSVSWNGQIPSLTILYTVAITNGSSINGLEFDPAGNLYVISNSAERLSGWALPKAAAADNTFTTTASSTQPVSVGAVREWGREFIVTAPPGTEHVYVIGKIGDGSGPDSWNTFFELYPTGVSNKFSGYVNIWNNQEYLYSCEPEKGESVYPYRNYYEGTTPGGSQHQNHKVESDQNPITHTVNCWYHVKKLNFNVSFDAGVAVPSSLSVRIIGPSGGGWTPVDAVLSKSGSNTFTGSFGGNAGDFFPSNTEFKYFAPYANEACWENHFNRIYPDITNISGYWINDTPVNTFIIGDYFVPNSVSQRGWATLKAACDGINSYGIAGDVTLKITDDITESRNIGLVNNTAHSIKIHSATAGVKPTITFTQTAANGGPAVTDGAFVIGCSSGFGSMNIAAAKNITVDSLNIIANGSAVNVPLSIIGASEKIEIKNCSIRHNITTAANVIQLRSPAKVFPKNILFENNRIVSGRTATASLTFIINFVTADDMPTTLTGYASNIVLKGNILEGPVQRSIFLNYINGIEIAENEFHTDTPSGFVGGAIVCYLGVTGNVSVTKNKFIDMKTSNSHNDADAAGFRAIAISGGSWSIENNYFAGFSKPNGVGTPGIEAINVGTCTSAQILHNTFYLNPLPSGSNYTTPPAAATDGAYCAIRIGATAPIIANNLFVSAENAGLNYAIRGNAPDASANNVYYLTSKSAIATVSPLPSGLKEVEAVYFANTTLGSMNLDLVDSSKGDKNLSVPLLSEVPKDIYGTDRQSPKTYAGAFEAGVVFTGITTSTVNDTEVICIGNQLAVSGYAIQSVKLLDLQGRTIEFKQNVNNGCLLTAPAAGIYLVEIWTETGRSVHKVAAK